MPTDDRDWVLDAAATVPGVHGAYHLVDPATGNGLSIAFFEDEAAAHAVREAIEKRAEKIGWNSAPHAALAVPGRRPPAWCAWVSEADLAVDSGQGPPRPRRHRTRPPPHQGGGLTVSGRG
ncbi:hypothetical protein [Streptomyces afghaniensis]|nr:hypothetical protein [Streptomyces afghaniensis]